MISIFIPVPEDALRAQCATLIGEGLALKARGQLAQARAAFERALALDPACAPAHVNCAGILRQMGLAHEALAAAERAIELQPELAEAHCNRGLALSDLDEPARALQSFERALECAPNFTAALGNRGKALQALNLPREALRAYDQLLAIEPDSAQGRLNASHAHLQLGEFVPGWALYESRKQLPGVLRSRRLPMPLWLGEQALAGNKLLLHWEQGLGDTIQFARYGKLAAARGSRVVLCVQKSLVPLMRTLDSEIRVCSDDALPTDCDLHCPLMSLPLAFDTRPDTVPAEVPYLHPDPQRVQRWRERIGTHGFRVGINWQGSPHSPADRGRSLPAAMFEPLGKIAGVRLISMQVGAGAEQLENLPPGMAVERLDADFDRSGAFLDSAAVLHCLDLLITSDTALAHLGGALGRPTWVLLQQAADWRWLQEGEGSPWYPGMRLFRQTQRGDWVTVIKAVQTELAARAHAVVVKASLR